MTTEQAADIIKILHSLDVTVSRVNPARTPENMNTATDIRKPESPAGFTRTHGSESSPALTHHSKLYPANYRGRVPRKIKMAKTLYPDEIAGFKLGKPGTMLELNMVYDCWVNSHGAVAGYCENGENLGVKPGEFDVVEWHETKTQNGQALR